MQYIQLVWRDTKYFFFFFMAGICTAAFQENNKTHFSATQISVMFSDLKTLPEMLLLSGNTQTRCSRNTGNTQNIVIKYKVNLALSIKRLQDCKFWFSNTTSECMPNVSSKRLILHLKMFIVTGFIMEKKNRLLFFSEGMNQKILVQ